MSLSRGLTSCVTASAPGPGGETPASTPPHAGPCKVMACVLLYCAYKSICKDGHADMLTLGYPTDRYMSVRVLNCCMLALTLHKSIAWTTRYYTRQVTASHADCQRSITLSQPVQKMLTRANRIYKIAACPTSELVIADLCIHKSFFT